jgi:photosystem II cytochrome c550
MLRKYIWLLLATVFFTVQMFTGTAYAAQLDAAARTVNADDQGNSVTLTLQELENGQKLFNNNCASCHAVGVTKTNPSIDLTTPTLALATPARDNVAGLVDYFKDPTTYDGETSIAEVHPSMRSADIFPKMRNLSDKDLELLAGYILVAPKMVGEKWGGGKIYY